jgi:hypothetical protein
MIKNIFSKPQKQSGCVVIVGSDTQLLSQNFFFLDQARKEVLHTYQVIPDSEIKDIQIHSQHEEITVIYLNLINPEHLKRLTKYIAKAGHTIELTIFQPTFSQSRDLETLSAQEVENNWESTGLSAVNLSQAVIGSMLNLGGEYHNSAHYDALSQSMFASIRALSQSLAREFQPKGIHIAYCMVQQWEGQNYSFMAAIKNLCQHIYQQPATAWTQELSL